MKNKLVLLGMFFTFNSFAGMTVENYEKSKSKDDMSWYLVGLGNGFDFSNTELESLKQKKLYCRPEKSKISEADIKNMINSWINENKREDIKKIQIEPVILSQLIKKYPCK